MITSITGDVYHGGVKDNPTIDESQSNYFIRKKELALFIKKAAEQIDTIDSFEQDPMDRFPLRYR